MLLVKGFCGQSVVTIDDVKSLLSLIPKTHLAGLSAIVYDPCRFYERNYALPKSINYRAAGQYDSIPIDYVLIHDFRDKIDLQHIIYHEIGHHFYKRCLSQRQRKEWVLMPLRKKCFVSEYAKTNASEDFAETYAFALHSPDKVRILGVKGSYIFNLIVCC